MDPHLRQHPRFVDQQRVEVQIADRAELQQLWLLDISKGGMFLQTETPPPLGAQLQIQLATPDGSLRLNARVVHVVDLKTAAAFKQPAGVGLQFVDLSKTVRDKIERYVDGLADRLSGDLVVDKETEPFEVLLEEARRIMTALNESKLYGALGVAPEATPDQVQGAITELCHRFAHPPSDCPPPKAARMAQLCRQLERTATFFTNPIRRLHYDFQHGYVRVKEREAAGQDREQLRQVWGDVFPERVVKARELGKRALSLENAGKIEECALLGAEAAELDPFNPELRHAAEEWKKGQKVGAPDTQQAPAPDEDPGRVLHELLEINKKMEELDHFQVLGVEETANTQDIAKAYLYRTRRYDPEQLRGRVPQSVLAIAGELHRRVSLAYKTLADTARRQEYLASKKAGGGAPQGAPSVQSAPSAQSAKSADQARTKNEMGIVFLRKNEFQQAREMFQQAVDLAPTTVDYQASLAWAMIADGEFDRSEVAAKARPLLNAAIDKTLGRNNEELKRKARYHYYLGRLLREQGQMNAATENFERAVEFNPKLAEASTELRLIQMRKRKK